MEQLNKMMDPTIIKLTQQRRLRRKQGGDGAPQVMQSAEVAFSPLEREGNGSSSGAQLVPPGSQLACTVCKDRGYVRLAVAYGHPQFGKAVECSCRQARKQEVRRQMLWKQSQLDELAVFQEESFETFQLWLPEVQEAYEAALQFAEEPQGWLVLAGGNGCGKTHLAVSIAKRCLEQGATVLFAVVPDLLDRLRLAFAPTAEENYDEAFRRMREAEILVLDDLGAEASSNWVIEILFQLLNYRYNARLATVITTNQTNFEGIVPRLRSRLRDRRLVRTVVLADARDFRELEFGG